MKKLFFLTILLVPGIGLGDKPSGTEIETGTTLHFGVADYVVQLIHRSIESEEKCPSVVLLSKNRKRRLSAKELCEIRIPGYRDFHALKDFAYIDFSNYRLREPSTILYDIDLDILKGNALKATCAIEIDGLTILAGKCAQSE